MKILEHFKNNPAWDFWKKKEYQILSFSLSYVVLNSILFKFNSRLDPSKMWPYNDDHNDYEHEHDHDHEIDHDRETISQEFRKEFELYDRKVNKLFPIYSYSVLNSWLTKR